MIILLNEMLTVDMLPAKDDADAIYAFALTLESTGGYDSFQEAHDVVAGAEMSLTDIRMELFFAAKTFEAVKTMDHVDVYNEYYDALVDKITNRDFA
ncbi:MAG: hypothetical protein NZ828_08985 [Alphaproteobacteria bacterium]|nr:hypothetical protein [Alphaproteobacteria bacterium]